MSDKEQPSFSLGLAKETEKEVGSQECDDDVDRIRHRSLPTAVIQFVASFEKHPRILERLERIQKAGLGSMLSLKEVKFIPTYFLNWVMDNFEEADKSIRLGDGRVLKLTEEDVERVYMLPRGPKLVDLKKEKKEARDRLRVGLDLPVVKKGTSVLMSALELRLRTLDDEDFWFKGALLYILGSLLCPRGGADLSLKYAFIFEEDLDSLHDYNWCRHVLEHTTKALSKKKNTKANFHFLLVNYLDRMGINSPIARNTVNPPMCMRWDMLQARKVMAMIHENLGLGAAVTVGYSGEKEVSTAPTSILLINADTCPSEKLVQYASICEGQMKILNDQLTIFKRRIGNEGIRIEERAVVDVEERSLIKKRERAKPDKKEQKIEQKRAKKASSKKSGTSRIPDKSANLSLIPEKSEKEASTVSQILEKIKLPTPVRTSPRISKNQKDKEIEVSSNQKEDTSGSGKHEGKNITGKNEGKKMKIPVQQTEGKNEGKNINAKKDGDTSGSGKRLFTKEMLRKKMEDSPRHREVVTMTSKDLIT